MWRGIWTNDTTALMYKKHQPMSKRNASTGRTQQKKKGFVSGCAGAWVSCPPPTSGKRGMSCATCVCVCVCVCPPRLRLPACPPASFLLNDARCRQRCKPCSKQARAEGRQSTLYSRLSTLCSRFSTFDLLVHSCCAHVPGVLRASPSCASSRES